MVRRWRPSRLNWYNSVPSAEGIARSRRGLHQLQIISLRIDPIDTQETTGRLTNIVSDRISTILGAAIRIIDACCEFLGLLSYQTLQIYKNHYL